MAADGAAAGGGRLSGRRRAIGLAAGLLILAFLALGVAGGWDRVDELRLADRAGQGGVAASSGCSCMYLMSALGYVLILERLAHQHVPRTRFVAVWARSLLGRYVPGNVLMVRAGSCSGSEAGIPAQGLARGERLRAGARRSARARRRAVLLAGYGPGRSGARAWLVAIVPLGLLVLDPRLFGRLSHGRARDRARALEALLTGRQLLALFAWYLSASRCSRSASACWSATRAVGSDPARCSTSACRSCSRSSSPCSPSSSPRGSGCARAPSRSARAQAPRRRGDHDLRRRAARAHAGGAGVRGAGGAGGTRALTSSPK